MGGEEGSGRQRCDGRWLIRLGGVRADFRAGEGRTGQEQACVQQSGLAPAKGSDQGQGRKAVRHQPAVGNGNPQRITGLYLPKHAF